jgi:hypothetical protein
VYRGKMRIDELYLLAAAYPKFVPLMPNGRQIQQFAPMPEESEEPIYNHDQVESDFHKLGRWRSKRDHRDSFEVQFRD